MIQNRDIAGYSGVSNKKYSPKRFYIFDRNLNFKGRKPVPEDFVINVSAKCIGVYAEPGMPMVLKCKIANGDFRTRSQDEVYNSFEDCLEENKDYIDVFLSKCKKDFERSIQFKKDIIKTAENGIKELNELIKQIDSLN